MMLDHLGHKDAAKGTEDAIENVPLCERVGTRSGGKHVDSGCRPEQ